MDKLTLNSYAKLNLYLEVRDIRRDTYHNLITVFERINLSDRIILKPRPDTKIKIKCTDPSVPKDKSNFCYRAAQLLQNAFKIKRGLEIEIIKRIPVAAGLGGGSSNAATLLLGLNKFWKLNLTRVKLAWFAQQIGSDVPFFVYNTAFAQGSGRGERIKALKSLNSVQLWHILVVPRLKISTPFIYKKWDEMADSKGRAGLTRPKYNVKILPSVLKKKELFSTDKLLFNNLEQVTFSLYPEVERIKEEFASLGLKSILMSGSGPAVFGIVSSRKEAVTLSRRLEKQDGSRRVFVTSTH